MLTETPRAKRLPLPMPINYRSAGEDAWLQGRILNISESGVMFAPAELAVGQAIELILSTPIPIQSIAPGRLVCMARVVRIADDGTAAAQFDECRFLLGS